MKEQVKNTRKLLIAGFLLILVLGPLTVHAQAPFLAEGPIQRVLPDLNQMVVMGVTVSVPPGTPITTPTTTLTGLREMLGAPLPGRDRRGFLGGTAIIEGTVIAGVPTAATVFCEPAENVFIGTVSAATCLNARCSGPGNILEINGTPMRRIADPRLRGTVTNEFGFAVDLTGFSTIGTPAESEGYFARGKFRYFLLAVTGAPLANPGVPEVSITRARCRNDPDGIELDVVGNTHPQGGDVVTISDGGANVFGTQATISAGVAGFGAYTFRLRGNAAFTSCPANVTAEFLGATATLDVDIIP